MRKFVSISLAVLLVAMSLKMTLAVHYCNSEIAAASIGFGHFAAEGCGMSNGKTTCTAAIIKTQGCCQDLLTKIALETEYNHLQKLMQLAAFQFDQLADRPLLVLFPSIPSVQRVHFSYTPPPDVTQVFRPFIQVFIL